jgi:sterol desaturase/sphingolipid hydroxylase (fatty acid hydroxylase superfamily)
LDRNFAGIFPWIDLLFGTFHMWRGLTPHVFGVREGVAGGFGRQLLYPVIPETRKYFSQRG